MENVLLSPVSLSDLQDSIRSIVKDELEESRIKNITSNEYLSRQNVADLFKISLTSVHNWCQTGILRPYKVSGRVRFRKDEVLAALQEITPKRRRHV